MTQPLHWDLISNTLSTKQHIFKKEMNPRNQAQKSEPKCFGDLKHNDNNNTH